MSSPPAGSPSPSSDTEFEFFEEVRHRCNTIDDMRLDMQGWLRCIPNTEPLQTDLLALIEVCSLYMSTLRCEMFTSTIGAGPRNSREEFLSEAANMFDTMHPEYVNMFHTLYPRYLVLSGPNGWTEF
jgi:hypothetical protein